MDVPVSASESEGERRSAEQPKSSSPTLQILKCLEEPRRRSEPVEGTKDILVWWDIETCPIIPPGTSTGSSTATTYLLRELQRHVTCDDISVTINVYGNGGPGSKAGLDSLLTSGVALRHRILPCKQPGAESAAMKTMMVDIALWALATPAPANVFLISAARDASFRDLISGLHARDYNIRLATKFSFGDDSTRQLFNPMPRHWSASMQLFAARSRLQSRDEAPNIQLPEKLQQLHLHS